MITDVTLGTATGNGRGVDVPGSSPPLGPEVLFLRVADGSARLLNLDGRFLALEPVAAGLLSRALAVGNDAASQETADAYGVPAECVRADLGALLDTLRRDDFLRPAPAALRGDERPGGGPLDRLFRASLRRLLARPGRPGMLLCLAWLSFRTLGWSRTIKLWGTCADEMSSNDAALSSEPAGDRDLAAVDANVVRAAAGHPVPVACKERALVAWALLKRSGRAAWLVLGVALYPFRSHCWCAVEHGVVADHADRCEGYTEVRRYR